MLILRFILTLVFLVLIGRPVQGQEDLTSKILVGAEINPSRIMVEFTVTNLLTESVRCDVISVIAKYVDKASGLELALRPVFARDITIAANATRHVPEAGREIIEELQLAHPNAEIASLDISSIRFSCKRTGLKDDKALTSINQTFKVHTFMAHDGRTSDAKISNDGKVIATLGRHIKDNYYRVNLWSAQTGELIRTVWDSVRNDPVNIRIGFTADSRYLMVSVYSPVLYEGFEDEFGRLLMYDAETGALVNPLKVPPTGDDVFSTRSVWDFVPSPFGRFVAVVDTWNILYMMDLEARTSLWDQNRVPSMMPMTARFSLDGERIAFWTRSHVRPTNERVWTIEVRDVRDGKQIFSDSYTEVVSSDAEEEEIAGSIEWVRGSQVIAYQRRHSAKGFIKVVELGKDSSKVLLEKSVDAESIFVTGDEKLVFGAFVPVKEHAPKWLTNKNKEWWNSVMTPMDSWSREIIDIQTQSTQASLVHGEGAEWYEGYDRDLSQFRPGEVQATYRNGFFVIKGDQISLQTSNGEELAAFSAEDEISDIEISPNGRYLVVALNAGKVMVLDVFKYISAEKINARLGY